MVIKTLSDVPFTEVPGYDQIKKTISYRSGRRITGNRAALFQHSARGRESPLHS